MNANDQDTADIKSLRRTRQSDLVEVVGKLADIHTRLSVQYVLLADRSEVERVRLIFQYLSSQEASLARHLREFLEQAPEPVMNRRFKYVPELECRDLFSLVNDEPPGSVEGVIALLQKVHKAIDTVYEPLAENMLPEDLAETVEKLRLQEREHAAKELRGAMDE